MSDGSTSLIGSGESGCGAARMPTTSPAAAPIRASVVPQITAKRQAILTPPSAEVIRREDSGVGGVGELTRSPVDHGDLVAGSGLLTARARAPRCDRRERRQQCVTRAEAW